SRYAVQLAELLDLSSREIGLIREAALLHDVGKFGIRDGIFPKPGRLTPEERAEMERHPTLGADMVARLPEYQAHAPLIRHPHEAWDGSGYPSGLAGEAIPLGARIIAVADAYDAMSNLRPYRPVLSTEEIVEQFRQGRGRQWDPRLVDLWLEAIE